MRSSPLWAALVAALVVSGSAEARKKKNTSADAPTTTTTAAPAPADTPPAAAEPPPPSGPKLVVVPIPASGAERWGEMARQVSTGSIESAGKQSVLDLADALDPTAASARAKAGKEGRAQLRAAHGAYDQLDMEVSSVLCDKAYANFLKSDLTKNFSRLVEAWELKIAIIASDPSKADLLKDELSKMLPVDSRDALSPNLFNPDVVHQADAVRQSVKSSATLTLSISTRPAPAQVFVDGVFRGISPVQVNNLAPADHFVTIVSPGFKLVQTKINPHNTPQLNQTLDPAELNADWQTKYALLAKGFPGPGAVTPAGDLATWLKADQILLVEVDQPPPPNKKTPPSGVHMEVERIDDGEAPPKVLDDIEDLLPDADAKFSAAADALITKAISEDNVIKRVATVEKKASSSGGSSSALRYVGFGMIGLGVVAGGGGAFFGLGASSAVSSFKTTPQDNAAQSTNYENTGKQDALLANSLYIGAGVIAAVGIVLAIVGGGHPAPAKSTDAQAATPVAAAKAAAPPPARTDSTRTPPADDSAKSNKALVPEKQLGEDIQD